MLIFLPYGQPDLLSMVKTMKLYLQKNFPDGKRVRLIHPKSLKKEFEVVLFPDRPTEVADAIAVKLQIQDPHLVGTEPYSAVSEVADEAEAIEAGEELFDTLNELAELSLEYVGDAKGDEKQDTLSELAELVLDDLKSADIVAYGKKLGIEIPNSMKREQKVALLDKRCHELRRGGE